MSAQQNPDYFSSITVSTIGQLLHQLMFHLSQTLEKWQSADLATSSLKWTLERTQSRKTWSSESSKTSTSSSTRQTKTATSSWTSCQATQCGTSAPPRPSLSPASVFSPTPDRSLSSTIPLAARSVYTTELWPHVTLECTLKPKAHTRAKEDALWLPSKWRSGETFTWKTKSFNANKPWLKICNDEEILIFKRWNYRYTMQK